MVSIALARSHTISIVDGNPMIDTEQFPFQSLRINAHAGVGDGMIPFVRELEKVLHLSL
jgi:hypothetical protein